MLDYRNKCINIIDFHKLWIGESMNKLQKISFIFSILVLLNYAIHTLLGFKLLYPYLRDGSFITYLYAFLVGISAFINLTILNKH